MMADGTSQDCVSAPIANADALPALTSLLRDYFDGLYFSDTRRLRRVFHAQQRSVSGTDLRRHHSERRCCRK